LDTLKSEKEFKEYRTKLDEYKSRLTSDEREKVELWQVEEYYSEFPLYKKRELGLELEAKCNKWLLEASDAEDDFELLQSSFKRRNQLVFNTLIDEYFERLSKEQQKKLILLKGFTLSCNSGKFYMHIQTMLHCFLASYFDLHIICFYNMTIFQMLYLETNNILMAYLYKVSFNFTI
uniref:Casc1_N domain-containing protein n=1 Tax=Gongylonema pulchrum TaxID=637853 RepID=A0A183ELN3_9BILA